MKTRMKELREKHHLTQEQLADKVGARRETILFMEKGKYNPSLLLAYRVAKVLKSRIENVFFYDDQELFPKNIGKLQVESSLIRKTGEGNR